MLAAGRVLRLQLDKKSFRSAETQKVQTVLQNIVLDVQDQEFVCLFGPSGCGKTTLLNLIAGIDSEFEGKLTFGSPTIGDGQTSFKIHCFYLDDSREQHSAGSQSLSNQVIYHGDTLIEWG